MVKCKWLCSKAD